MFTKPEKEWGKVMKTEIGTIGRDKRGSSLRISKRMVALGTAGLLAIAAPGALASTTSYATGPDAKVTATANKAIAEVLKVSNYKDPNGLASGSQKEAQLTSAEISKIKSLGLRAGIAMHSMSDAWSLQIVEGFKTQAAALGITVVGVTDATNDPAKQTTQIESLLAAKPDFIFSLPTDPVAMAPVFKKVNDAGIKIVFSTLVPTGFMPGTDYVTMITDNRYQGGVISAYQLAAAIGGKGEVAQVFYNADNFTTNQGEKGFQDTMKQFPKIKVYRAGIIGPDFAAASQAAVSALFIKHPKLAGGWGTWDFPGEGIMAAARAAGRKDFKITTMGFGEPTAVAIASNKLMAGTIAIDSNNEGQMAARLGAVAVTGTRTAISGFFADSPIPVTNLNIKEGWKAIYKQDAPKAITSAYKKLVFKK
jgi:ribose transport system substrate-binding protein